MVNPQFLIDFKMSISGETLSISRSKNKMETTKNEKPVEKNINTLFLDIKVTLLMNSNKFSENCFYLELVMYQNSTPSYK